MKRVIIAGVGLLFTLLDCGLVKYYIVAEGRTYLVNIPSQKNKST